MSVKAKVVRTVELDEKVLVEALEKWALDSGVFGGVPGFIRASVKLRRVTTGYGWAETDKDIVTATITHEEWEKP